MQRLSHHELEAQPEGASEHMLHLLRGRSVWLRDIPQTSWTLMPPEILMAREPLSSLWVVPNTAWPRLTPQDIAAFSQLEDALRAVPAERWPQMTIEELIALPSKAHLNCMPVGCWPAERLTEEQIAQLSGAHRALRHLPIHLWPATLSVPTIVQLNPDDVGVIPDDIWPAQLSKENARSPNEATCSLPRPCGSLSALWHRGRKGIARTYWRLAFFAPLVLPSSDG
jgi:hypothetical protein